MCVGLRLTKPRRTSSVQSSASAMSEPDTKCGMSVTALFEPPRIRPTRNSNSSASGVVDIAAVSSPLKLGEAGLTADLPGLDRRTVAAFTYLPPFLSYRGSPAGGGGRIYPPRGTCSYMFMGAK